MTMTQSGCSCLYAVGISSFFKVYVPVPVKMFPACVLAPQMGWGSPCKIKQVGLPDLLEIALLPVPGSQ